MAKRTPDLTGIRYGKLTAIRLVTRDKYGGAIWECVCDCGTVKPVSANNLRRGLTKSCGCHRKSVLDKTTHGQKGTRLYHIWDGMRHRCNNPNSTQYHNYGKRGIAVCEEWEHFEPFYKWAMANGYRDDLTIDRIDNDKGYSPDNCRWATMQEQANNKTTNRYITYCGVTKTLTQWAAETGISIQTIKYRLSANWSIERVLTTPVRKRVTEWI